MSTVYGIGFTEGGFLMVRHPVRGGWEMPGGSVEPGETAEEAVVREYIEESGRVFTPLASRMMGDVTVFAGRVGPVVEEGEMPWRVFDDLPDELSFPREEYAGLLEWARRRSGGPGEL